MIKSIKIDKNCPQDIALILYKIAENCGKDQYWNALGWNNDLQAKLLKRFDEILKGRQALNSEKGKP